LLRLNGITGLKQSRKISFAPFLPIALSIPRNFSFRCNGLDLAASDESGDEKRQRCTKGRAHGHREEPFPQTQGKLGTDRENRSRREQHSSHCVNGNENKNASGAHLANPIIEVSEPFANRQKFRRQKERDHNHDQPKKPNDCAFLIVAHLRARP
jgi:hypothetical protein